MNSLLPKAQFAVLFRSREALIQSIAEAIRHDLATLKIDLTAEVTLKLFDGRYSVKNVAPSGEVPRYDVVLD